MMTEQGGGDQFEEELQRIVRQEEQKEKRQAKRDEERYLAQGGIPFGEGKVERQNGEPDFGKCVNVPFPAEQIEAAFKTMIATMVGLMGNNNLMIRKIAEMERRLKGVESEGRGDGRGTQGEGGQLGRAGGPKARKKGRRRKA